MSRHGQGTRRAVALISSLVMLLTMIAPAGAQESTPRDPADSPDAAENTQLAVEKIDEDLQKIFETQDEAQFLVLFEEKADTSAASGISDWEERGRYVYETLTQHAEETQTDVVADLDTRGVEHESFWIVNTVLVTGTADSALAMAQHPEVERIEFARNFEIPEPEPVEPNNETQATEWGLNAINAPDVWDQYGATGEDIVVGVIDSGVQWDHPALINHYRGNSDGDVDHEYNWYDPTRACGDPSPEPCAVFAHGTHVTGTVVGDDGGDNQIGVAPGAKYITSVGCDIPPNQCSTQALLESGQWMAAPTDTEGNNENPDMRPHIVNNSWGGPGGDDWYMDIVNNWIAFGMFPQFASGNPGSACGAAGSPGDYAQSYSSGGFDINGDVYSLSGRGPSQMDGGIKPNISAPAVNVRSSVPGDGYASFNGTSMASPHVAGSVAVIWSAAPALSGNIDGTKALLNQTAVDTEDLSCGGTPENNNVWGEGKLDLLAAMNDAPIGDTGTLEGTVTDSGGQPIAGATIDIVGPFETTITTAADGTYSITLPIGEYTVTASAYGYVPETADVSVAADATTTQDFTLESAPSNTVTGIVTDGGGHGWPLYSRIDIPEHPDSPFFTDPVTGEYSVELLEGTEYTMEVSAVVPGYVPETRPLLLPDDDPVQDFALDIEVRSCAAPGYLPDFAGVFETFDAEEIPGGWEVVDNLDNGQVWTFNNPGGRDNLTGGEGNFAIVDSDEYGSDGEQDTELISPPVDYTQFENPSIDFKTDYNDWSTDDEVAAVDLSLDNGATWENVWQHEGSDFRGDVSIDIPQAADAAEARVRFHYYDASFSFWWQVDDVLLGELLCLPEEAGLVVGNATDLDTGDPIVGATVSVDDNPEDTTETVATPEDPALDDGFYILGVHGSGDTDITASMNQYAPTTETVAVAADGVVSQDFQLASGQLEVAPESLSATLEMGATVTQDLEISNVGSGAASFSLLDSEAGFDPAGNAASETLSQTGAPELRIEGQFSPLQSIGEEKEGATAATPPETDEEPWVDIADYPSNLMDASAATGPDGLVYVVGGIVASGSPLDTLRAYDPETDTWSDRASMQNTRQKPGVAFVGDRLYVAAGWSETGGNQPRTDIYDPATDTWTSGADAPVAHAAPGVAVVDDVIYLVGGCQATCGSADVVSYDTSTDTWATETDYPLTISWTHCGSIAGTIFCAGGIDSSSGTDTATDATYSYDPAAGTWTEVAPIPETLWAGASIATTEHLMISGGVTDGFSTVSNVGYFYDPAADSWDSLPNANNARYRSAGACGFYKIGGSIRNFDADPASEHLPGFDLCGSGDAPWLSEDPTEGTLAPGESTTVTVTYDASVGEVNSPGVYHANLIVSDDTPHSVPAIPVEMTVNVPANWGKIDVNVEGLEHCDAPGSPLAGATVEINGSLGATDGDGYYFKWLEEGTYAIAVSAGGFVANSGEVTVVAGETVTFDQALRRDLPCAEITPEALDFEVRPDESGSAEINFSNTGAGDLQFRIGEVPASDVPGPAELEPVERDETSRRTKAETPSEDSAAFAGREQTPGAAAGIQSLEDWELAASLSGGTVRFARAQCPDALGSFYKIAGVTTDAEISDETSRYAAATNTWTHLAPMPGGGREAPTAVCTEDGRIHVIGGTSGGAVTDTHFVYDIASDTWEQAAPAPRNVWTAASAVWDGKLYLVGGANSTLVGVGNSTEVNVYDIATDTWEENAEPLPAPNSLMGYAQAGQYLYVAGGSGENAPSNENTTLRFDMEAGGWESGPEFSSARADLGLVVTDSALYALGGDADAGGSFDATNQVERLDLFGWPDGEWDASPNLPVSLSALSASCAIGGSGDRVHSIGGATTGPTILPLHFAAPTEESCLTGDVDVPWLSVDPAESTVPGDSEGATTVTVDTTGLEIGEYGADLRAANNDPAVSGTRIPVNLTVVDPAPVIDEAPEEVERRETVTLVGRNFLEPLVVNFGNRTIGDVDVTSETELTFEVPRNVRFGDYAVTVTTPEGTSNQVIMTVVRPGRPSNPVITDYPEEAEHGETVTLGGSGFQGNVRVRFGNITIRNVDVINENELTFVVPQNAPLGATPTSVTTPRETSNVVTIEVVDPLALTTTELPTLQVFQQYEATVEARGGAPPYTWSATGLPPGLTIDPDSGTISNNPDSPGIGNADPRDVEVTVSDDDGTTVTVVLPLDTVPAVTVSAGSYHSCAIDGTGTTWCWGENNRGQLGDGGAEEQSTLPVQAEGDHEFVALSLGGEHTCALDGAGAAWCWGRNNQGQLGNDDMGVDSATPVAVADGHQFTMLSMGFATTCGIDTDDVAWCWGSDGFGQLGNGGDDENLAVPTMVGGEDPFQASTIRAGSHTCALDMAGTAWCWGYNASGQLGTGPDTAPQSLPVPVSGDHAFTSLVTGSNHTCGIDDAETTWCWGDNAAGQLGLGHFFEDNYVPQEQTDGPTFAGLHLDHGNSSCGFDTENVAYCWGSNNFGQLGNGQVGGSNSGTPIEVVGDLTFTDVSLGEFHTCGVDNTGVAWCWGANFAAQIGKGDDGFGTESGEPVAVHPAPAADG